MAIHGAHNRNPQITPHLVVRDARAAVDFYGRAFGAQVAYSAPMPWASGMHFHIRVGGMIVMVTDEMPCGGDAQEGAPRLPSPLMSPKTLGGTSMLLRLDVPDVDAAFKKAVDEGAHPTLNAHDTPWGDRYGWVTDPFGHIWALATIREVLSAEEVDRRVAAAYGAGCERH